MTSRDQGGATVARRIFNDLTYAFFATNKIGSCFGRNINLSVHTTSQGFAKEFRLGSGVYVEEEIEKVW